MSAIVYSVDANETNGFPATCFPAITPRGCFKGIYVLHRYLSY